MSAQINNKFATNPNPIPIDFLKDFDKATISVYNDLKWQNDGKQFAIDYISKDYNTAREEYYTLIKTAENALSEYRKIIMEGGNLTSDQVLTVMQPIAKSLIWREESYVCPPTIMHVVRILQANPNNPEKYPTNGVENICCDKKIEKVLCGIGEYGYIISAMEQLGYLIRFNITYCQGEHTDKEKCDKKINTKYKARYLNAKEYYHAVKDYKTKYTSCPTDSTGGRKTRKYRKRVTKNKKRKNIKNKSKHKK
jgi:hypothetical protein